MGTKNAADYAAAADAVRLGVADKDQREMNSDMARNAGPAGRDARKAQLANAKAAQKR
ncbi:MAG: hypothetical protein ABI397_02235 [Candidatus Saccharimonas sp.]